MSDAVIVGIDAPGRLGSSRSTGGFAVYDPRNDRLVDSGLFIFPPEMPERACYNMIAKRLALAHRLYGIETLVIEHPFIYAIAQWVGGCKMWASIHGVPWFMITSSSARKIILGSGKTGRGLAAANKRAVLESMCRRFNLKGLSQHEADALLYAVAYSERGARKEAR